MRFLMVAAATSVAACVMAGAASAATYSFSASASGNDCSGDLGTSPGCVLNGSPQIIKINFGNDGSFGAIEINSALFPTIDGSEFSFDFGTDGNTGTGTWTYTPNDLTDPGIIGFTAKGGNGYNIYLADGAVSIGEGGSSFFETPVNGSGRPAGLSHMTFFDSVAPVPLPAAGWMLLAGIGGLAALRRRRG